MRRAYRTATRYEYLFWDSALHRRPWPDFSGENTQPDENAQADNDNAQTDAQLGTQGGLR
jgi:hypothetical protein